MSGSSWRMEFYYIGVGLSNITHVRCQILMLPLASVRSQTYQFLSTISDYFLIISSKNKHTLGSASHSRAVSRC